MFNSLLLRSILFLLIISIATANNAKHVQNSSANKESSKYDVIEEPIDNLDPQVDSIDEDPDEPIETDEADGPEFYDSDKPGSDDSGKLYKRQNIRKSITTELLSSFLFHIFSFCSNFSIFGFSNVIFFQFSFHALLVCTKRIKQYRLCF